jgi:hypothetical protein
VKTEKKELHDVIADVHWGDMLVIGETYGYFHVDLVELNGKSPEDIENND